MVPRMTIQRNETGRAPLQLHRSDRSAYAISYRTILTSLNCAIATRKSRNESLGDAGAPTVYCIPDVVPYLEPRDTALAHRASSPSVAPCDLAVISRLSWPSPPHRGSRAQGQAQCDPSRPDLDQISTCPMPTPHVFSRGPCSPLTQNLCALRGKPHLQLPNFSAVTSSS